MSDANGTGERAYVLFVWSPSGYSLRELQGEPPQVGQELEENGQTLVITKLGASPLPGDTRVAAFTVGT